MSSLQTNFKIETPDFHKDVPSPSPLAPSLKRASDQPKAPSGPSRSRVSSQTSLDPRLAACDRGCPIYRCRFDLMCLILFDEVMSAYHWKLDSTYSYLSGDGIASIIHHGSAQLPNWKFLQVKPRETMFIVDTFYNQGLSIQVWGYQHRYGSKPWHNKKYCTLK